MSGRDHIESLAPDDCRLLRETLQQITLLLVRDRIMDLAGAIDRLIGESAPASVGVAQIIEAVEQETP